ncbi:MAG: DNA-binding protein [Acidobacteria bacterium]|nr:MAG: DNA-binding protein [Acidobacteriota bacterium]
MSTPDPEANRRTQTELYGAPVAELVGTVRAVTGLTQTALAKVLGLSAPMLSQLVSGQRIKISNPAAVARLEALLDLAHRDDLDAGEREEEIARIAREQRTLTSQRRASVPDRHEVVAALVAAAPADELARVARAADQDGELARLLDEAARAAAPTAGAPGDA